MKQSELMKAENRIKVTAALNLLNSVIAGDRVGVSIARLSEIRTRLRDMETGLYCSYGEIEEDLD